MAVMAWVFDVAKADAHVVIDGIGDGDGQAHAEGSVGDGERVETAIAEVEEAGDQSPDEGDWHQHGIGDVGDGEQQSCEGDGGAAAHAQPQEAQENVDLQDELLHQGPDGVFKDVQGDGQGSVEVVEGMQARSHADAGE